MQALNFIKMAQRARKIKCLRLEGSNFRLGGIAPITRAVPSFRFPMRLAVWVVCLKYLHDFPYIKTICIFFHYIVIFIQKLTVNDSIYYVFCKPRIGTSKISTMQTICIIGI